MKKKFFILFPNLLTKSIFLHESDLGGALSYLYHQGAEKFNSSLSLYASESIAGTAYDIFNPSSTINWVSTLENPNYSTFEIIFKKHYVYAIAYNIESEDTNAHPKNWKFQGSYQGESWTLLDEKKDNGNLNGQSIIKQFSVLHPGLYSRFQFKQTGEGWNSDQPRKLAIQKLDILGQLIPRNPLNTCNHSNNKIHLIQLIIVIIPPKN